MRILLLSNMYPSPQRPEYGVFVAGLADGLRDRGHQLDDAVLVAGEGGLRRYLLLLARGVVAARRRPDVIYAHFLVPTGLIAWVCSRLSGAPFVVTAHGNDVANAERNVALRVLTRFVLRRAAAVIAVSDHLAGRLPEGAAGVEVINCGVDTGRFVPTARAEGDGPRFVFVGALTERKNVGRLLRAFATLGEGSLTVVGAGPLGAELRAQAPAGVRFTGRLGQSAVADQLAAADVLVLPSLVEPQGQVVLEALACGRPVVATRNGGPAELIGDECGALVDPLDVSAIAEGMLRAARLGIPCAAAVAVAAAHDRRIQVERIEQVLERSARAG